MRLSRSELASFFSGVCVGGPSSCWLWTRARARGGYGMFWFRGKYKMAHRVAYEAFVGTVPTGLELDHYVCDHGPCVNPAHVRPVTRRENCLRSNSPMAWNAGKVCCPRGHQYSDENTRLALKKHGLQRICRTCDIEYKRRKRAEAQCA